MICKSCTCSSSSSSGRNGVTSKSSVTALVTALSVADSSGAAGSVFKSWSSPDLTHLRPALNRRRKAATGAAPVADVVDPRHDGRQKMVDAAAARGSIHHRTDRWHQQLLRKRSRSSDAAMVSSAADGKCVNCVPDYAAGQSLMLTCPPSASLLVQSSDGHSAGHSAEARVSTTLSWDSGYNDASGDDCYAVVSGRTLRMPSVVISDCSEEMCPVEQSCFLFHDQPSPTLSQSSSGEPCWTWPSSPRHSLASTSPAPSAGGLPHPDELAKNFLSVRRLSDCSSSSSLGTLDMDMSLTDQVESMSTFRSTDLQHFAFDADLETSTRPAKTSAAATPTQQVPSDPSDPDNPLGKSPSKTKISPWRKVRSVLQWSPFVQTFRRQRYPWVQLAGHQGNFKVGGERGTILKKLCPREESCFQLLMQDPLRPFIPHYKGHVVADDGEKFLVLEDLLAEFHNPSVMDCKLGVRTYLEDELAKAKLKPKLRKDMFDKMLQVDPSAPTAEELRLGGVTKPRYMIWRETISSTATLGFRIEGIRKEDGTSSKDFKTTRTDSQILAVFRGFVQDEQQTLLRYVERLRSLEATLNSSDFFANHELIGSSLLFIHDHTKANVWMIDFAKTHPLPDGIEINHRDPWMVGNHEDGYLTGLHNLIDLFEQLLDERHETV